MQEVYIGKTKDVIEALNWHIDVGEDKDHLCYSCERLRQQALRLGFVPNTTTDENGCEYACDIMYNGGEHFGIKPDEVIVSDDGNTRTKRLKGEVIFSTVDNGAGYYIKRCPFYHRSVQYAKTKYEKLSAQMKKLVDDLIKKGVSPDVAADNAGYVLYALLGGQARQETIQGRNTGKITEAQHEK